MESSFVEAESVCGDDDVEMIWSSSNSEFSDSVDISSTHSSNHLSNGTFSGNEHMQDSSVRKSGNFSNKKKKILKHKIEDNSDRDESSPKKSRLATVGKKCKQSFITRKKTMKAQKQNVLPDSGSSKPLIGKNLVDQLTVEKVKTGLKNGNIVTCEPYRKTKNSKIYKVCKRLKFNTGERIGNFLLCSKCGLVLNINLSTQYRMLTRHYEICTGISLKADNKITDHIAFDRSKLKSFIEQVMIIGAEYGIAKVKSIQIPKFIDGKNLNTFLKMLQKNGNRN